MAIFVFAVSTTITPGPNNIMIMTSGLNFGPKLSMPHYLGICIGFPVMVVMIGFGFGFVFEKFPLLHEVIKIAGIFYLLYLSWIIANSAPKELAGGKSKPISFFQAVLFQWINPKAWIMATSAVAAYTNSSGDIYSQVLFIGAIFMLVTFPCIGVWLFFGIKLKRLLQSPSQQQLFNRLMATLLVISILPIVYEVLVTYFA